MISNLSGWSLLFERWLAVAQESQHSTMSTSLLCYSFSCLHHIVWCFTGSAGTKLQELPAWINYASPCCNAEDTLILMDIQTWRSSKWQTHTDLHWVCGFITWQSGENNFERDLFALKHATNSWFEKQPAAVVGSTQENVYKSFCVGFTTNPGRSNAALFFSLLECFRNVPSFKGLVEEGGDSTGLLGG